MPPLSVNPLDRSSSKGWQPASPSSPLAEAVSPRSSLTANPVCSYRCETRHLLLRPSPPYCPIQHEPSPWVQMATNECSITSESKRPRPVSLTSIGRFSLEPRKG